LYCLAFSTHTSCDKTQIALHWLPAFANVVLATWADVAKICEGSRRGDDECQLRTRAREFPQRVLFAVNPKRARTMGHKEKAPRQSGLFHFGEPPSPHFEILGRFLAAICDNLIFDLRTLIERAQPRALNGGDVHEHVPAAALRLNEAITLGRIEPFHSTCCHTLSPKMSSRRENVTLYAVCPKLVKPVQVPVQVLVRVLIQVFS